MILFGSWALGNAKPGSDIDLAISGEEVDQSIVASFYSELEEETIIPHFFDVVHLDTLGNHDLMAHIKEHGIVIFSR